MNDDRHRILDMLAAGKITVAEAEQLLSALGESTAGEAAAPATAAPRRPTHFRVEVNDNKDRVNIRIPLGLVRAGIQLGNLIPESARSKMQEKLDEQGIDFDLGNVKPEKVDDLINQLGEFAIDVADGDGGTVRVFCE